MGIELLIAAVAILPPHDGPVGRDLDHDTPLNILPGHVAMFAEVIRQRTQDGSTTDVWYWVHGLLMPPRAAMMQLCGLTWAEVHWICSPDRTVEQIQQATASLVLDLPVIESVYAYPHRCEYVWRDPDGDSIMWAHRRAHGLITSQHRSHVFERTRADAMVSRRRTAELMGYRESTGCLSPPLIVPATPPRLLALTRRETRT